MVEQLRHVPAWRPELVEDYGDEHRRSVRQASPLTCCCGARLGHHRFSVEADAAYREHLLVVDGLQKLTRQIMPEAESEQLAAEVAASATRPER